MLQINNLSLRLSQTHGPLFSDIDLEIQTTQVIALQGPSGAGKTSLLRCMAGLEARAMAEINFQGQRVTGKDMPRFRSKILYLPQSALRSSMIAEESLERAFSFATQEQSYDPKLARELCLKLLLPTDILGQKLSHVSGGEAQRLSLIRALLLRPHILLLDEPASGLDPKAKEALANVLGEWSSQKEHALLICSHQPQWMRNWTTHTWLLSDGQMEVKETHR